MGRHLALLLPALLTLGCPTNNGSDPPNNRLFFPIAAALHRSATTDPDLLYVVNANFDLQYNGSTVTAVDLNALNQRVVGVQEYRATQRTCAMNGTQNCPLPALPLDCRDAFHGYDGVVCDDADRNVSHNAGTGGLSPLLRPAMTRKVNPYAVDAAIGIYPNSTRTSRTERLYVLVRGGNSLLWLDAQPNGALECGSRTPDGQSGDDPGLVHAYCDDAHASGGGSLAPDPSALSVDARNGWIVVAHQSTDATSPRATLFYDSVVSGGDQTSRPRLINPVGSLAPGLSGLVFLGNTSSRSTWIATSRTASVFTTLQTYPGTPSLDDNRAFLYRASEAPVTGLLSGADNRAIARDPRNPQRAYMTSRRPEALVTVDISNSMTPVVIDAIPLPGGPSRLAAVNDTVNNRTVVYTISYDARWIYAVVPTERQVIAQIPSGRGPHAIVHDDVRQLLYVLDFLDAAVEVIDVKPTLRDGSNTPNPMYNRRVLTFGRPGRL